MPDEASCPHCGRELDLVPGPPSASAPRFRHPPATACPGLDNGRVLPEEFCPERVRTLKRFCRDKGLCAG